MRKHLVCVSLACVAVAGYLIVNVANRSEAGGKKGPMLAHMVYFSLKDNSADAKKKLVAACDKYLSKHPGEVFYGTGTRCEDLDRPVNDKDFDVALHIVFADRASHDKYQDAPRHKQFIDENKDNWKKVRVFDAVIGK
jgi:Stress responsive A/B Barrel Domain